MEKLSSLYRQRARAVFRFCDFSHSAEKERLFSALLLLLYVPTRLLFPSCIAFSSRKWLFPFTLFSLVPCIKGHSHTSIMYRVSGQIFLSTRSKFYSRLSEFQIRFRFWPLSERVYGPLRPTWLFFYLITGRTFCCWCRSTPILFLEYLKKINLLTYRYRKKNFFNPSVVFLPRLTSSLLVPVRTCMHLAFFLSYD